MIQDVGNIELCELLETEPKTQCTACLSGVIYCTCGHFLHEETGVNRKFVTFSLDLLSVSEYVIKKGRAHGHRYGKKPGDKEYYLANQLKKKCKKRDSSKEFMTDSHNARLQRQTKGWRHGLCSRRTHDVQGGCWSGRVHVRSSCEISVATNEVLSQASKHHH